MPSPQRNLSGPAARVPGAGNAAASETAWRVYLFSDTGVALWEQALLAKDQKDAERKALPLVRKMLPKFDNAEDWVVEQDKGSSKHASDSEDRSRFQDAIEELHARLQAAYQWNQTAHWQSVGPTSYSDHLLFQRLYEALPAEIDGLAEKMVVMFGEGSVNAIQRMQRTEQYMTRTEITPQADPIRMALFFEENIHNQIKDLLRNWDDTIHMSAGLRNFLEGVYDAHETAVYLLAQRIKDSRILATTQRVAARYVGKMAATDGQLVRRHLELDQEDNPHGVTLLVHCSKSILVNDYDEIGWHEQRIQDDDLAKDIVQWAKSWRSAPVRGDFRVTVERESTEVTVRLEGVPFEPGSESRVVSLADAALQRIARSQRAVYKRWQG